MRREHRVLSTLYRGYPLAPRSYLLCTDPEIIGADFFVMELRYGIGLRQLIGWIDRWHNALTDDVGPAEPFTGWLRQTMPTQRRVTLVHNDYKLDNTLRDAADPRRTVAVLDWDMCTRGEPLMDLGYLLGLWAEKTDPDTLAHGRMPTWNDGFPTRREAAERYARISGAEIGDLHWYVVFSVFRYAVILQQIYIRFVRGQTHDERFRDFGTAVNQLTQRGLDLIDTGDI